MKPKDFANVYSALCYFLQLLIQKRHYSTAGGFVAIMCRHCCAHCYVEILLGKTWIDDLRTLKTGELYVSNYSI